MKKYFITGLVILLPLALTIAIVIFIFNLLTEPFADIFKNIFAHYGFLQTGFLIWNADQIQKLISKILILFLFFFFTVGLGVLARWFFIHYLIRFWEEILHRIPFISSVYKTCQDVIKAIFTTQTKSFKQVVMVPFPNEETLALGLITRENLPSLRGDGQDMAAVFVPTTPNPTSGFLMVFKQEDLIYLDMKVEEALKYVISCGVISVPFNKLSSAEYHAKQLKQTENNKEEPAIP
jgi:uncharacterized membrane protein